MCTDIPNSAFRLLDIQELVGVEKHLTKLRQDLLWNIVRRILGRLIVLTVVFEQIETPGELHVSGWARQHDLKSPPDPIFRGLQ